MAVLGSRCITMAVLRSKLAPPPPGAATAVSFVVLSDPGGPSADASMGLALTTALRAALRYLQPGGAILILGCGAGRLATARDAVEDLTSARIAAATMRTLNATRDAAAESAAKAALELSTNVGAQSCLIARREVSSSISPLVPSDALESIHADA